MAEHALSTPAIESAKPSRRNVMLATARLLALGGAAGALAAVAPSPENPDAALVAMCERIVAANDEMLRLESPYYDKPSSPPHVQARTAALVVEMHRLAEAAAEAQAATLEGLRAKAGALLACMCYMADGSPDWGNHDELLGWSIARDLKSFGPGAMAPVPAVAEVTSVPVGDAELIRLADLAAEARRQYCANLSDEVDIPPEVDAELDRHAATVRDCFMRAAAIRATTDAGKRAKAQIVTLANSYNLSVVGDPAFVTLESLLDDLMGGEGACAAFDWHVSRRDGAL